MKNVRLLISSVLCVFGFMASSDAQIIEIMRPFAGTGATGPFTDGVPATAGTMNNQYLINLDAGGNNLYIADNGDNRVRRVNIATGIITTVAGTGTGGSTGDGGPATAALLGASGGGFPGVVGVCADGLGNVFIADGSNHKIRKVDASGIITTIGGTGTSGFMGDGTPATSAQISQPRGIWVDASGNIYFSEGGGTTTRIRKIDASGIITTIAGNGTSGYVADGVVATTTRINNPRGLCTDPAGNVYIADFGNNRVRRIDAITNIITTIAGTGTAGYSGEGLAATASRLSTPLDVKIDGAGNLYIADNANNRVRKVDMTTGIMSTFAGSGTAGNDAGNWGPATASAIRLASLSSVAIMANGTYLFISDRQGGGGSTGNRVKLVRPNSIPYFTGGTRQSFSVCEDQSAFGINALLAIRDSDQVQTETWSLGAWAPTHGTVALGGTNAANGGIVTPTGKTYTPDPGYNGMDSFIVQISDGYDIAYDTMIVTINPLPTVSAITGSNTVCQTSTITLSVSPSGGTWSASNGNATVSGTGDVTGVTAGVVDISYTVTNSCGPRIVSYTVTVNPLPNAGTITGGTTVCVGATLPLADVAPGGVWSASNGNATVDAFGTVTGVSVGSDDISYTVTNVCGTVSSISTISINNIPVVAAIAGVTNVCVGASVILTDATPGGIWSASNGNATVAGGTVTGVTAGTDDISYTVTNTCGSTSAVQTMNINPLPFAGAISGSTNVCIGGTVTFTDPAGGGIWSASNGNATVSGTGDVTGVTAGTVDISYSVTNSCGTDDAIFTVNIVSTPSAGIITGPSNVCPTVTITLVDGTSGGTWSASNTNATVSGLGVVTGVTAGTVDISYTVTASCGTASTTHTVTVDPLPNPGAISGPTTVCLGGTMTLTDPISGGSWSSSNPATATVSSSGLVGGVATGLAIISYGVTNVCGTLYATQNVNVNPIVTPTVTITAAPGFNTCPGTLVTYTANPVNGGTTPVYEWRVNGFVLGAGSSFNHTPINGDIVSCKMTTSAPCVSAAVVTNTVTVVVNPSLVPVVHITTGAVGDTVCIGDLVSYTASPIHGGSTPSYMWYVNGTPAGGGNPFSYVPTNGDIVTCALTSSYVCPTPATVMSNSVTMTVDVTENPAVTITVSPVAAVCTGSPVTLSAHPLYGGVTAFYRWTKNGVNVATGLTYSYIPANGDNVYCMLASGVSCRTIDTVFSNHIHMNVDNPDPISVTITQSTSLIGVGDAAVFTAVVATTALTPTYQWYVNGTAVPAANSNTFTVTGTVAGTKTISCVAATGDACYTTATSNLLPLNIAPAGVSQYAGNSTELKLLPNPNKGVFVLNMNSANDEQVHVLITNIIGKKVKEFTTATNKDVEVTLAQPAGIYLVTVTTGQGSHVTRMIVN